MANEEKFTPEFKIKVAKEAIAQDKQNLDKLSDQYDLPVSTILTWTMEYEKGNISQSEEKQIKDPESEPGFDADQMIDLEVNDPKISEALQYGAMKDEHNYKRLIFWCVFGVLLVVLFIESLRQMYGVSFQWTLDQKAEQSEFYNINELRGDALERLNSFGVIDQEEGIYRIPIDSAINELADGE